MESRASSRGWAGKPLEARVVASRRITPTAHSVLLQKPPGFSFGPTQFTFLSLKTEDGFHTRPMSIATSPTRPTLEYAVRVSDSPFKRAFAALRPGEAAFVQGPFGRFLLREDRPAVLVAGGIGITPLKGMAEYAADKGLAI
ncbi:MAG TPA: FAD-dependent oxidoreductase, partial [Nitrososphaerales archaeon]|nr:FAD-dependent oxidoreductase [Nitrososphaerales archaeon]